MSGINIFEGYKHRSSFYAFEHGHICKAGYMTRDIIEAVDNRFCSSFRESIPKQVRVRRSPKYTDADSALNLEVLTDHIFEDFRHLAHY